MSQDLSIVTFVDKREIEWQGTRRLTVTRITPSRRVSVRISMECVLARVDGARKWVHK